MKELITLAVILTSINAYAKDNWECIAKWPLGGCNTWRMPAYGGWIIASEGSTQGEFGLTYVPDAKHEWKP